MTGGTMFSGFLPEGVTVKARARDLTGARFSALTAIRCVGKDKNKSLLWQCSCDCGRQLVVPSCCLTSGKRHSCGCYRSKAKSEWHKRNASWNLGRTYTLKGEEDVFASKKAWGDAVKRERGDRCHNCAWDKASCDVHHLVPVKDGGKNTVANAVVLCPNCHRCLHRNGVLP